MTRSSDFKAIPQVSGDQIAFNSAIKQILETYQGNVGNVYGLDRVVKFRDLLGLDPTAFTIRRPITSRITRITGNIIRTGKIESSDSTTYFDLDNDKIVFNAKINYASQMPGIFIGKDDDGTYKFNMGHYSTGEIKFDGTNTYLGLWTITPHGIGDNITENSSKIFLDKTNTRIRVGQSSSYINIDGENLEIRSSNYVSGVFGAGFLLKPDLLEVGNIACRGIIRTAVFQKDVVSCIGGNLAVLPADVLSGNMDANDILNL